MKGRTCTYDKRFVVAWVAASLTMAACRDEAAGERVVTLATTTYWSVGVSPAYYGTDSNRVHWSVEEPAHHAEVLWTDPMPIDMNLSVFSVPATCDASGSDARACLLLLLREDMDRLVAECGASCRVVAPRPVRDDGLPVEVSAVVAIDPFNEGSGR